LLTNYAYSEDRIFLLGANVPLFKNPNIPFCRSVMEAV